MATGIVFDIQKFSVHDGPGIRTTVFLKGCHMHCIWCHNPESIQPAPQLSYGPASCVSCGACGNVCPAGVHAFGGGGHRVFHDRCVACGRCVEVCPVNTLKIVGREMDSGAVLAEVLTDKIYYQSSGGGVTFTGGEPTRQFEFLRECLVLCKENGVNTCLETNGMLPPDRLTSLASLVDMFLLDYKATGDKQHRMLTGAPGDTAQRALQVLETLDRPVVLRCPIVPGVNDSDAHFAAIRCLKERYHCIREAEIMGYHAVGRRKWEAIGQKYALGELANASKEQIATWQRKISNEVERA